MLQEEEISSSDWTFGGFPTAIPAQALALAGKAAVPKPKAPLVRIGTRFFREATIGKGKEAHTVLVPVEVEVNLDPLEVAKAAGVLGAVAVAGGIAAYIAWEGLTLGTPFGPFRVVEGLKDSPFWKAQAEKYGNRIRETQSRRQAKAIIAKFKAGGFPDQQTDPDVFSDDPCVRSEAAWKMETQPAFRAAFKAAAKKAGCEWAQ